MLVKIAACGLIDYRSLKMVGPRCLRGFRFGTAAHIVAQVAHDEGRVYAFTRAGENATRA